MIRRTLIVALSLISVGILLAADPGTPPDPAPTMTWEQKMEQVKTSAAQQIQLKEEIRVLEQKMAQAATEAEKNTIRSQIAAKEGELVVEQAQYQKMITGMNAYKYQYQDANKDGQNDNVAGTPVPETKQYLYKNGYGYGYGFVDEDGDGVNDNFVDADQDGKCDLDPAMVRTRDQVREKTKAGSKHGDHAQEQTKDQVRPQIRQIR